MKTINFQELNINRSNKILLTFIVIVLVTLFSLCEKDEKFEPSLTKEQVGKLIFFDKTLSNLVGQSWGSCHASNVAFTDPTHSNISPGAVDGLFGNRNAPTVGYAMFSPELHFDNVDSIYIGGQFWDGRVNSLEEQEKKSFSIL